MKRIIISWLAFNKDFKKAGNGLQINLQGPTLSIHQHLFERNHYDFHFLLQCSPPRNSELERKIKAMQSHLDEHYSTHQYKVELLKIAEGDLNDYDKVAAHLRSFLQKIDVKGEIEVITGTGSSIMHMAWVALFYSMDLKFKLYLMHHDPIRFPDPIPVSLSKSKVLDQKLKEFHLKEAPPEDLVMDTSLKFTYKKAEAFANAIDQNILILGETGTGKDLLAKHIVKNSPLYDKPYFAINCASLPDDNLLYSELFGHTRGAYTGATKEREGLFIKYNSGTLFMDEIGDISMRMQLSLLRAIENNEIKPLGKDEVIQDVNVRIIAATNADLLDKCEKNEFRWDLYYRLCDCELKLDPFRHRKLKERIGIIDSLMKEAEKKWGYKLNLTEDAKKGFYEYPFPGNFREIRITINSLFALKQKSIRITDLPERFFRNSHTKTSNRKENEKQNLERIYRESGYNMAETARRWGHSNSYVLKQKMQKLGIEIHK